MRRFNEYTGGKLRDGSGRFVMVSRPPNSNVPPQRSRLSRMAQHRIRRKCINSPGT